MPNLSLRPVPCSVPEYKANVVKVMRSILRENVRRTSKGDVAPDRGCRERLAPLRGPLPSSARIGEAASHHAHPSAPGEGSPLPVYSFVFIHGQAEMSLDDYQFTAGPGSE